MCIREVYVTYRFGTTKKPFSAALVGVPFGQRMRKRLQFVASYSNTASLPQVNQKDNRTVK
jgi:hypothetical protein